MKLHIGKGTDAGRTLEPASGGYTLGRGRDNDFVLAEEGASRHHCRIEERSDGWYVEDLGSMNGVHVNGRRIDNSARLRDGDSIEICGYEMQVDLGEEAPPPTVTRRPEPEAADESGMRVPPAAAPPELRTPLPWGRISLLAGMCMLIAALAFLWLSDPGTEKSAAATPTDETGQEDAGAAVEAPAPLSDQELDQLIAEQEQLDKAGKDSDTATPPVAPEDDEGAPAATAPDDAKPPADDGATKTDTIATETAGATDMVVVRSTPSGAKVLVDDVEKGTTPAIVTGLEKGRHRLTLQLAGYQDHQRLIHVPDVPARAPYLLRQKPNTLHVSSDPAGVSVWRGSQWLGVTPILLTDLPTGELNLTLAMFRCPLRQEKVTISAVRGEQLHVEMKPQLGDLTITTLPPGCHVLVDTLRMGTTTSETTGPGVLGTVRVPNLLAGDRIVQVEHPCGAKESGKLTIAAGGNLERTIRLWVPDTQIVLLDGTIKNGMLFERTPQGDIDLLLSPQQKDKVRYLKPRIRSERALTEDEARETFQNVMHPGSAAATKHDGKATDVTERWGDEAPADSAAPAREPARDAKEDDQEEQAGQGKVMEFTDDELNRELVKDAKFNFLREHKGTTFVVTGKVSSVRRDGLTGSVRFGRRICCEFERDVYERERKRLGTMKDNDTTVTIRGRVQEFNGDRLVLVNCVPVYKDDEADE